MRFGGASVALGRRRLAHRDAGLDVLALSSTEGKKLELETNGAAEKAAQSAASNAELEARVRIRKKIAADSGIKTAAQIETLREKPQLENGDKVQ